MKVVFLYTELAEYIRNCFERLAHSGAEVHVVAYPINIEAPFEFDKNASAKYYDRNSFNKETLLALVQKIDPSAVFCSGWIDKEYIEVMQKVNLGINRILISDNAFSGSLKNHASLIRAKAKFKKLFDFAFVSGSPQKEYAKKMGFRSNEVFTGFYTADDQKYLAVQTKNDADNFPKRLVFVGRYFDFKGVQDLWDAFVEINTDSWELHCAGTGPLWESRTQQKNIYHHGFLQVPELLDLMNEGGIFVLPSHKEPWGVVVHEFAAAGFPLLLSNKVNARTSFLNDGYNGYTFKATDKADLKKKMIEMMNLPSSSLNEMSQLSRDLAQGMSVSRWLKTVEAIANRRK